MNKLSLEKLNTIHGYIKNEFELIGLNLKMIIFCPHHWNDNCNCRKPKTGMFYDAQKLFDIDLTSTPFVGDQKSDKEASKAASVPFYNLQKRKSLLDVVKKIYK